MKEIGFSSRATGRSLGGITAMDELLTRVGDGRMDPEEQIVIHVLGDG